MMISYRDALEKISQAAAGVPAKTLTTRRVPLCEAPGAVLAEDLVAPGELPVADNAAMDGFAVVAAMTSAARAESPVVFPVLGEWIAGAAPDLVQTASSGVYAIMTGAILPPTEFDAVIKIEDVEVVTQAGQKLIKISAPVPRGNNIKPRGCDFIKGQKLLARGHRLRSGDIMALAGLGISEVQIFEKVRVAVLSTGQEIIPHDQELMSPQQVRNSSTPYLAAALSSQECTMDVFPLDGDTAQDFAELFKAVVAMNYQVIITTGGVSMGSRDFVTGTLVESGVKLEFQKVAIRPGKPLVFGLHEATGTAVFGLPGNPVATVVGARFFVNSYLRTLRGEKEEQKLFLPADVPSGGPVGLTCFYRACFDHQEGVSRVKILPAQGSSMLHTMLATECWLVVTGESVEVYSLHG